MPFNQIYVFDSSVNNTVKTVIPIGSANAQRPIKIDVFGMLYMIDDWNNEEIKIKLNGTPIFHSKIQYPKNGKYLMDICGENHPEIPPRSFKVEGFEVAAGQPVELAIESTIFKGKKGKGKEKEKVAFLGVDNLFINY